MTPVTPRSEEGERKSETVWCYEAPQKAKEAPKSQKVVLQYVNGEHRYAKI